MAVHPDMFDRGPLTEDVRTLQVRKFTPDVAEGAPALRLQQLGLQMGANACSEGQDRPQRTRVVAAVGNHHSHSATAAQQAAGTQRQGDGSNHQAARLLTPIINVASCLARSGTARLARQSRIGGPICGWSSIQRSMRRLPREKHQAASSRKGTVGSRGSSRPTAAAARLRPPAASHSGRRQVVGGDGVSSGTCHPSVTLCRGRGRACGYGAPARHGVSKLLMHRPLVVTGLVLLACSTALGQPAPTPSAFPGRGKLLLTGGVSSIDGAAGGGLTPWALTASHATNGEIGATAHLTRVSTQRYALNTYGVALGVHDRYELSLAQQRLDAGVVVPGATLALTIAGAKLRLAGDAIVDSDRWMPQIAAGVLFKHLDPGAAVGGVLDSAGAQRRGIDVFVSATKLLLAHGLLVNGTLRATRANQNGLLGFGSAAESSYSLQPDASVAWLLRRDLALGAEFRTKPDNLAFAGAAFREDAWKDVFIAWAPNKHLSLTLAYVQLGNIVGHRRQQGAYLSAQFGL
jgi:hypothetical protein